MRKRYYPRTNLQATHWLQTDLMLLKFLERRNFSLRNVIVDDRIYVRRCGNSAEAHGGIGEFADAGGSVILGATLGTQ
jgi:hypothetical protein